MNSTITTEITPDPAMSLPQYMILGGLFGVTIHTSSLGIIGTMTHFRNAPNFFRAAIIMTFFNVWTIIFTIMFSASFFFDKDGCVIKSFFLNLSSHFFFTTFDAFILYKTLASSRNNMLVFYGIIVILVHRLGWAVADLIRSKGIWDPTQMTCEYTQDKVTGLGYNSADLISDSYATIVCILFNYQSLTKDWITVSRVLIEENVLRSLVIATIQAVMIYINTYEADYYTLYLCFTIQNFLYTAALNSELYWIQARKHSQQVTASRLSDMVDSECKAITPTRSKV